MFTVKILDKSSGFNYGKGSEFSTAQDAQKFIDSVIDVEIKSSQVSAPQIIDLSKDDEYQEKIRLENIKKESPSLDSMIEALIEEAEGNPEKLTEILMIREEIRLKYPPIKE